MSNDKDFKIKNGIQPTSYFEGVGTVVSAVEGYYLAGASYDGVSFLSSGQGTHATGLSFKTDGTKMYILNATNDSVYQYTLSTAWDVSTASYDSVSFSITSQDTEAYDLHIKPDGTKFYVAGYNSNTVYQYSMSTAWDLSTASYDSVSFSVSSQENQLTSIYFKTDGTKLYAVGITNDTVYQYTLSTAWNVSTASYDSVSFSVGSQEINPASLEFNSDGSTLFVIGGTGQDVNYYTLSTAWNISTASYTGVFDTSSEDTNPQDIFFKPDGTKMYLAGRTTNRVHQYSTVLNTASLDLSTGSVFDLTPTSDIEVALSNPADSGTASGATLLLSGGGTTSYDLPNGAYSGVSLDVSEVEGTIPRGLTIADSGNYFYFITQSNDTVYQYSFGTAYTLSSATYTGNSFDLSSQDTNPVHVEFKPDGTKMYMVGTTGDAIYQYSLSTAWDVSTASYDSVSFSVSSQSITPVAFTFKTDGTKMYLQCNETKNIFQYSLSTAWDISTLSYDSVSLSITSQDGGNAGISISPDGVYLFFAGFVTDAIYKYTMSTAWDLSTASYSSESLDVSSEMTVPVAIQFSSDGKRAFVTDQDTTDTIYQYSTATPATITYDTTINWSGGTAPTSTPIGETDVLTFNTTDGGTSYQGILAIDGAKA